MDKEYQGYSKDCVNKFDYFVLISSYLLNKYKEIKINLKFITYTFNRIKKCIEFFI